METTMYNNYCSGKCYSSNQRAKSMTCDFYIQYIIHVDLHVLTSLWYVFLAFFSLSSIRRLHKTKSQLSLKKCVLYYSVNNVHPNKTLQIKSTSKYRKTFLESVITWQKLVLHIITYISDVSVKFHKIYWYIQSTCRLIFFIQIYRIIT